MSTRLIVSEVFYVLIGVIFALVGIKALKDQNAQRKLDCSPRNGR